MSRRDGDLAREARSGGRGRASARFSQGLTEAGHQVVEVAVGHHQDHVAGAQSAKQALQERIGVSEKEGFPACGR